MQTHIYAFQVLGRVALDGTWETIDTLHCKRTASIEEKTWNLFGGLISMKYKAGNNQWDHTDAKLKAVMLAQTSLKDSRYQDVEIKACCELHPDDRWSHAVWANGRWK